MFKNLKAAQAKKRFKLGYNWAITEMLNDSEGEETIKKNLCKAFDFGTANEFDKGAAQALDDFERAVQCRLANLIEIRN